MCAHQLQGPNKCVEHASMEKLKKQENLVQKQDSSAETLEITRELVEMEAEWEREMSQIFRQNINPQRNWKLMASPHGEEDIKIVKDIEWRRNSLEEATQIPHLDTRRLLGGSAKGKFTSFGHSKSLSECRLNQSQCE